MNDISRKFCSRKFWLSVAAFLGSIAASIAGLTTGEKWITITGIVCGMLSAGIYAAAEAHTDGTRNITTHNYTMPEDAEIK